MQSPPTLLPPPFWQPQFSHATDSGHQEATAARRGLLNCAGLAIIRQLLERLDGVASV